MQRKKIKLVITILFEFTANKIISSPFRENEYFVKHFGFFISIKSTGKVLIHLEKENYQSFLYIVKIVLISWRGYSIDTSNVSVHHNPCEAEIVFQVSMNMKKDSVIKVFSLISMKPEPELPSFRFKKILKMYSSVLAVFSVKHSA